ncbi:hypothetical protein PV416_48835, partial [Streptomyces ipomoeae]
MHDGRRPVTTAWLWRQIGCATAPFAGGSALGAAWWQGQRGRDDLALLAVAVMLLAAGVGWAG